MKPGGGKEEKNYQAAVHDGISSLDRIGMVLDEVGRNLDRDVETTAVNKSGKVLSETSSLKRKSLDLGMTANSSAAPAESSYVLFFQVLFPFVIAGLGMVFAGLVLSLVVTWPLFKEVPEILILVPALLGLKGNLEMTLASRLSTLANLGHLDSSNQRREIVFSNLALVQVQATVVAFLASSFATCLAWTSNGQFNWTHSALMCASSLATACSASLVLSLLMAAVIVTSRKYNINPDNVATPIAASLGDLTTLSVLAFFGSIFLRAHKTEPWLNVGVIILFLLALPFWANYAKKHEVTKETLYNGWTPVISSMLISSAGGFILEFAVKKYPSLSTFGPVLNGVGGNLAAVQASRISTYYHSSGGEIGIMPNDWIVSRFVSFKRAFFSKEWDSRSARVLLLLVVPGHIFFNFLIQIFAIHGTEKPPHGPLFTSFYMIAAIIQVMILLFVCQFLVALLWKWKIDPDNSVIPYLTALGDLMGTFLLFVVFSATYHFDPAEIEQAK
ncbi:unnamed protein product [Caenorhabditis angaria]|uniref:SLC41A/MgtE integral membrane domain-containing protein n=1 Tax=Caenorhabditis angaria TaxID=860376 RepID=A0A9P1IRU3_9PELO|nr:unnamed protein product [Caenorhabditis angaria]